MPSWFFCTPHNPQPTTLSHCPALPLSTMSTTTSIQDYTLTTAESHHIQKIQQVLAKNGSRPALAASILTGRHMDHHHHHHQNNHNHNTQIPFSRTLLWKTALLQIDITHGVLEMTALRSCRDAYTNVVKNIGIPWHLLNEDSIYYKAIDNNLDDLQVGEDLANLQITPDTLTTTTKTINVKKPVPKQEVKGDDDPLSSFHMEKTGTNTSFSKPRKDESDLDVLLTIIGDVERLFPEHPDMFITSMEDKVRIITVLYRYAKWINHERESQGLKRMGYVQGMHELCGVLYAVLKVELVKRKPKTTTDSDGDGEGEGNANRNEQGDDLTDTIYDSKDDNVYDNLIITPEHQKQQLQIIEFLSADYFEHDLFAMFQQLMSPIIDKYFTSSGIVRESIVFDLKLHHLDPGNAKHPGLATCLKKAGIESQLWLTRWFRMILTRELGLAYSVRLWDGLIAYACVGAMADTATNGHDISVLLPYVVMLLVIRIRSCLLKSMVPCIAEAYHEHVENNGEGSIDGKMDGHVITDETEALSLLLHYPTSSELGVALSRSVSPEPSSDNTDDDDGDSDGDGDDIHMANGVTTNGGNANKEPMLMYRKSRDLHKQSRFKAPLERCMALHKLPSAVDLFADAAHICGLSDSELTQVGPSLIEKYAGGDVYDLIDSIEKSKPSPNHFFEGVMKTTRLWRMTSSNSKSSTHESMKSGNKPPMHVKSEEKPDGNRTRLEMKLQQRVQDRLRDRSAK